MTKVEQRKICASKIKVGDIVIWNAYIAGPDNKMRITNGYQTVADRLLYTKIIGYNERYGFLAAVKDNNTTFWTIQDFGNTKTMSSKTHDFNEYKYGWWVCRYDFEHYVNKVTRDR